LAVIAERIENRATADPLVSMGCEQGQGYFFGRSMPAQEASPDRARTRRASGSRKSSLSNDFYEACP
jgi:EAL domain-containing protein (putative c-di-GMP-specific phosphodiesterase class I)